VGLRVPPCERQGRRACKKGLLVREGGFSPATVHCMGTARKNLPGREGLTRRRKPTGGLFWNSPTLQKESLDFKRGSPLQHRLRNPDRACTLQDIQAHVEVPDRMGERAHADDVDPGRGVPGEVAAGNPPETSRITRSRRPRPVSAPTVSRTRPASCCRADDISPGAGGRDCIIRRSRPPPRPPGRGSAFLPVLSPPGAAPAQDGCP